MPEAAPLEPGDPRALGRYEVVGRLGAGGQGAVFLGRSHGGEYVAIKLLHTQMASDKAARARFAREVTAASKVDPQCTARVLDFDVEGEQPYVISEFIDGASLHDVIAHRGPMNADDLLLLAIGTATALAAIHEAGIVHRDFKPNNVMLASDGPRVVDFGIARTVNSQESAVTATGMVVGTPGYLAPEQLTGAPLTPAVDIFAWGATMVFAATGQSPFEAETLPVIINRILNEDPDLSGVPAGPVRAMVQRALSKDAGLRPPAPQLLLQLLQSVNATPAGAASGDALLDQGTRIAARLDAPPAPAVPPSSPYGGGQQITPPPMPMHQGGYQGQGGGYPGQGGAGPVTPPPSITPPPMPMYQGAPPQQGQRPPAYGPPAAPPVAGPPATGPMYGPPPKSGGSNAPLAIGIGCGVLVLVVIVVIVIAALANGGDPTPRPTLTVPTYTPYTPPSTSGSKVNTGIVGVWTGPAQQPGAQTNRRNFTAKFALLYTSGTATYTYPDGTDTCYTNLAAISGSAASGKAVFRETPMISSENRCAAGYVTFYPTSGNVLSLKTIRWDWREKLSETSASAFGTVSR
ncbi:serine/threonine-protein kinase [Actinomadura harenae]|uniref:Serine/threonine protein kinase n=1 Tax=Actinomadura harenae TaxID=2483351 RepID=A0A3M2LU91_9ACTN|nr:serine/threonine-protein kinase [Actinomadura harenae]RMI40802.1 serine/threonine protein kinase [Actinomadura harenae]